jgi:UDP-glucose 4-epimerase
LHESGYEARAALRSASLWPALKRAVPSLQEWVDIGELGGDSQLADSFGGVEVVIHLAARVHVMKDESHDPLSEYRRNNVLGTVELARAAAAAGVRRFVFISTVKVNGESTPQGPFNEADLPAPLDPYALSKWEAEEALHAISKQTGIEVTIVRPPLLYGPGVRANFLSLMKLVARGIPLPIPDTENRRSLLGVENLAHFLVHAMSHELAANEIFLLSDGEDLSTRDLVRRLASALDTQARFLPISASWIRFAGNLLGKQAPVERLLGSLAVDSSKARGLLQWTPPLSMEDGLHATALWYQESISRPAQ